jgi:hypothetical protein
MTLYDDRTLFPDEALMTELREHMAAVKELATTGIAVIAGEGRRLEYTKGNMPVLQATLRDITAAASRRGLVSIGPGGAIPVEIR